MYTQQWYMSFRFADSLHAKLRKVSINFIMSVPLRVRLSARRQQIGSHWTDVHEI